MSQAGDREEPRPRVPVPVLAPLRVPAYRRVWSAMTVSHLGTYLQLTAAPWLMLQMTGSPLLVSLVTTALFLPRLVLTLPAGAIADVVDRRTVMLVGQGISAVSVGTLAVIVAVDRLTPTWLLLFTLLLGVGSAIDKPAYQTRVPDLVPLALRAQAITLNSGAHHGARIVGPSLGGLLVAFDLAEVAFAGNAVSFLIVMGILTTLPRDREVPAADRRRGTSSASEGIRFVRGHAGLRRLLAVTAVFTLSSASLQALLPNVVADDLGLGAKGFGGLYAVFGAGALIATATRERAAARWDARMLPLAMAIFAGAAIAVGATRLPVIAGAFLVVAGLAWVWTMTTLNATVQLLAPSWVRGRVVALYVLAVAMKPIGALVSGLIAEVVGASSAIVMTSFATLALAVLAFRLRLPVLGRDTALEDTGDLPAGPLAAPGPDRTPDAHHHERGQPDTAFGPGGGHMSRTTTFGTRAVPALGLGCMSMSHPGRSDETSRRTILAAYEAGVRHFDTADRYGRGHNERLLGATLRHVRAEVLIATKVGFVGKPGRDVRPVDGSAEHIRAACDRSLLRLGTDRIDLLYLHRVDPEVPIEETVGAMADLVEAGKVGALGLSEISTPTLQRALTVHAIAAVQSEYSLWSRDVETDVLPACRAAGVAFVAYSPLGIGFLTGRYRDRGELPPGNRLARGPRTEGANLVRNLGLVEHLDELARQRGCTAAQLALAWVLAQGVAAIPGSSRPEHLAENLGAQELVLDNQVLASLGEVFQPDAVSGERKPPPGLALTHA
jgi:aryl-alcohol dehydrogenase-like predicted oxidoreductase/predicted MFS family arabinose efflux permease